MTLRPRSDAKIKSTNTGLPLDAFNAGPDPTLNQPRALKRVIISDMSGAFSYNLS